MVYKKHGFIKGLLIFIFIISLFIGLAMRSEIPTLRLGIIIRNLGLLDIVFILFYQQVELFEDHLKARSLNFIFPISIEIPYSKINDVVMSTYLPGLSIIYIKTGNNQNTRLSYFQKPKKIKEYIVSKIQ